MAGKRWHQVGTGVEWSGRWRRKPAGARPHCGRLLVAGASLQEQLREGPAAPQGGTGAGAGAAAERLGVRTSAAGRPRREQLQRAEGELFQYFTGRMFKQSGTRRNGLFREAGSAPSWGMFR